MEQTEMKPTTQGAINYLTWLLETDIALAAEARDNTRWGTQGRDLLRHTISVLERTPEPSEQPTAEGV